MIDRYLIRAEGLNRTEGHRYRVLQTVSQRLSEAGGGAAVAAIVTKMQEVLVRHGVEIPDIEWDGFESLLVGRHEPNRSWGCRCGATGKGLYSDHIPHCTLKGT